MKGRNRYPPMFGKTVKVRSIGSIRSEQGLASISESEVSQDTEAMRAVYQQTEGMKESNEKNVQTISRGSSLSGSGKHLDAAQLASKRQVLKMKLRETPRAESVIIRRKLRTSTSGNELKKVVRLKQQNLTRLQGVTRPTSAQPLSLDRISSEEILLKYETEVFKYGPAELPPTFPISFRTHASAGTIVTNSLKKEAVLGALNPFFGVEGLEMALAFQAVSQVYSVVFVGEKAPVSRCCGDPLVFELEKTGEVKVKCSNETCKMSLLQVFHLPRNVSGKLWVEERVGVNRKLSNTLSLFIQRGSFRLKPIRDELDRLMVNRELRPQTSLITISKRAHPIRGKTAPQRNEAILTGL